MHIVIVLNEKTTPVGKLADAELHFDARDGLLDGLRLQGFAVWQARWPTKDSAHADLRCTVPARSYQVNGESRTWNLVRGIEGSPVRGADDAALTALRDAILDAYVEAVGESIAVEAHRPAPAPVRDRGANLPTNYRPADKAPRVELPARQAVARAQHQVRRGPQPAARPTASDDYPF